MDYFEKLNDPLKYYFKEKIGNLYINKDVIGLFINKGNKGEGSKIQELSNSFLNFSEIKEIKKESKRKLSQRFMNKLSFRKKNSGKKMRSSIELYEEKKKKKQINAMMINKVVENLESDTDINKMSSKFGKFIKNDAIVKNTLNVQASEIEKRIFERKQKSMVKGKLNSYERAIKAKQLIYPERG